MIITILFAMSIISIFVYAQGHETFDAIPGKSIGYMPVGFGATFINGERYYLIYIAPEVAFGDLGVGLDMNLRFNTKGKLRAGDYNTFEDYLRMIGYVRWAQKGDPIYARLGQLDYSLLGHGSIIYNYNNGASYDLRRTGVELGMTFEKYGFESMYSDLAGKGLLGMRGYAKPLKFTSLEKIPIINNFEVGVTYARDLNANANRTSFDSSGRGLTIVGFDLGLPFISYPKFKSTLYLDHAQIVHYGYGTSIGISANYSGLGFVNLKGKYEVRFNGVQYLPAYFNAMYEYDRFNPVTKMSKSDTLQYVAASRGYYEEIAIIVLNTFNFIAGYQAPFSNDNQGVIHAELQMPEIAGILIRGSYDKTRVGRLMTLNNNSILSAEIGYKPVKYLMISTLYQRTFSDRDDKGMQLDHFVSQDRVEPKISFIYEF